MTSMLTRAGYGLDDRTGIWRRADFGGIAYSDGAEVEQRIGAVIDAAGDLSILSEDLRAHCVDWPSLYHLSASRANILRPYERRLGGDVLEIGAGCGAITRYLGECGGDVLALEGSLRRAAIARSRTRDLSNVNVVTDRFADFQCDGKFDIITLIGVLEYANLFTAGDAPALAMLERARSFLKPDGLLLIAIENQLGLKYFAGAAEDHIGRAMYGIEGRYRSDEPQTFGRKALAGLLAQAGFSKSSFLAPFPDYKFPISIVAESGFLAPDFDAAALACQSVLRDPQLPQLLAFSPELVWPTIAENGLALDLSNSFLVAAGNGDELAAEPSVLAWHYTVSRRKALCKTACFARAEEGRIEVMYRLLAPAEAGAVAVLGPLGFSVPEKSAYFTGRPLSQDIVEILSRDGWTFEDVGEFFRGYIHVLETMLAESDDRESGARDIDAPDCLLPGFFFDMAPHNLIVTPDGKHRPIDEEWDLAGGVSAGFLMFRSFSHILALTRRIGHSTEKFESTPIGLFMAIMEAIGWPVTRETIYGYAELESTLQVAVRGGPNTYEEFIYWFTEGALIRDNLVQRVEEDARQIAGLKHTVAERDARIAELDQKVAELHASVTATNHRLTRSEQAYAILASGMFSPSYYLFQLQGPWRDDVSLAIDYLESGEKVGLKPSPLFDPVHYLANNVDVANARMSPLMHYILHGRGEGRQPIADGAAPATDTPVEEDATATPEKQGHTET